MKKLILAALLIAAPLYGQKIEPAAQKDLQLLDLKLANAQLEYQLLTKRIEELKTQFAALADARKAKEAEILKQIGADPAKSAVDSEKGEVVPR